MQISLQSNIEELTRKLPAFYRKQIPFATSQALNDTARKIATDDVRKALDDQLDNPTPYTKAGFRYKRSTKRNLVAQVYSMPSRWAYLQYAVNGGVRRPRGRAISIATGKRNKYGNKPRGWLTKQAARSDTFWGDIGGTYGLWQKARNGKVTLLAYTTPSAQYKKRFNYLGAVSAATQRIFPKAFSMRMRAAMNTARI